MINSISSNAYSSYANYANSQNNANHANLNSAKSMPVDLAQNLASEQASIQTTIMDTANKMGEDVLSVLGTNLNIQA